MEKEAPFEPFKKALNTFWDLTKRVIKAGSNHRSYHHLQSELTRQVSSPWFPQSESSNCFFKLQTARLKCPYLAYTMSLRPTTKRNTQCLSRTEGSPLIDNEAPSSSALGETQALIAITSRTDNVWSRRTSQNSTIYSANLYRGIQQAPYARTRRSTARATECHARPCLYNNDPQAAALHTASTKPSVGGERPFEMTTPNVKPRPTHKPPAPTACVTKLSQ